MSKFPQLAFVFSPQSRRTDDARPYALLPVTSKTSASGSCTRLRRDMMWHPLLSPPRSRGRRGVRVRACAPAYACASVCSSPSTSSCVRACLYAPLLREVDEEEVCACASVCVLLLLFCCCCCCCCFCCFCLVFLIECGTENNFNTTHN